MVNRYQMMIKKKMNKIICLSSIKNTIANNLNKKIQSVNFKKIHFNKVILTNSVKKKTLIFKDKDSVSSIWEIKRENIDFKNQMNLLYIFYF